MTLKPVGENRKKKISAEVAEEDSHKIIYVSFDPLNFIKINSQFSHKCIYVRYAGAPRPRLFFLVLHVFYAPILERSPSVYTTCAHSSNIGLRCCTYLASPNGCTRALSPLLTFHLSATTARECYSPLPFPAATRFHSSRLV